jgi:hypothetical protein
VYLFSNFPLPESVVLAVRIFKLNDELQMAIAQLSQRQQRNSMLQNPRNTDFIVIST